MDMPVTGPAQIPATVEVICGTLRGTYDVAKTKILYLSHLGGVREATPTEFERLGGRQATKKWKQSIRVVDSSGQAGKSLGEWLAGTAGTAGEGQRHALAWLSMGQQNGGCGEGGEGGRGAAQSDCSQLREQFQAQLLDFLSGRVDNPGPGPASQAPGSEVGPVALGSHSFDLRRVYSVVCGMGGYAAAQATPGGWDKVAAALGMDASRPNTACACRSVYEHYLLRAERLERAREAVGLPPLPSLPPRREPRSPSVSDQSPPARTGPQLPSAQQQQQQQQQDRHTAPERPSVSQQRTQSTACPPPPYGSRRAPPPPPLPPAPHQWAGSVGRGGFGGGLGGNGHDRRSVDELRYPGGSAGYGGHRSPYAGHSARNGGDRYDLFLGDDGGGVYDGPRRAEYDAPARGMYDRPARGYYDGPGRDSYDGPVRGGYDGPPGRREGYDMGGRGEYDDGRRGYDNGDRGYYEDGDRDAYDMGRRVVDLGSREPYDDRRPSQGGGGGGRYLLDPPTLERRLAGLEALARLQETHALQERERRYGSQYEQRPALLPGDVSEEQLMLAVGRRLQGGGGGREGGPVAPPLLLDAPNHAPAGRQQSAALRFMGGEGPQLQLHLGGGGGGGGRQLQHDPRDALLAAANAGLGGRGALMQAQLLERGGLAGLAAGLGAAAGRMPPVALDVGGSEVGGSGVGVRGRPHASRSGGGALQLPGGRAAALLGLQGGLAQAAGVDEAVLSSLLSEYGRAGLPVGLVRTNSGNIGLSGVGLGLGGAGYKRGEPDEGPGGDGDYGGGPHKRPAV